jgi:hypothetical protein
MYIFAKFVPDHIFLQNRDKLNINFFAVLLAGSGGDPTGPTMVPIEAQI